MKKPVTGIILAGGKGERMGGDIPKPLVTVAGETLLERTAGILRNSGADPLVVVESDPGVRDKAAAQGCITARQKEALGTADALKTALNHVKPGLRIIVTCVDIPLVTEELFDELCRIHEEKENYITITAARVDYPAGYGRVIIEKGRVRKIIEEKEATAGQKKIKLINSGIYCMETKGLLNLISRIGRSEVKGEYYLTDLIEIAAAAGKQVGVMECDYDLVRGVNTPGQLEEVRKNL